MSIVANKKFEARECPSCATEVAANNNRCPICGYEFPNPSPVQKGLRIWGAVLMLAIFAALLLRLL